MRSDIFGRVQLERVHVLVVGGHVVLQTVLGEVDLAAQLAGVVALGQVDAVHVVLQYVLALADLTQHSNILIKLTLSCQQIRSTNGQG